MSPLRIWCVTDGRAGIETQALGLAEAVASVAPADITIKRIGWPRWMRRLPSQLVVSPRRWLTAQGDPLAPPWPDLWIGNGRASIPMSIGVRRWSGGATFVVQVQDPLRPSRLFDLVVPPNHDQLSGPNVFAITGTPHRVTPERLAAARAQFAADIEPLPRPRIAALIGGRSRAFDLSPGRAVVLADQIGAALSQSGGSLMLTFSRRTPEPARAILTERLKAWPGRMWSGEGSNPYFAYLAWSDVILVTEDSANMPAEAAATGRPVHLLRMDGRQARKRRFHAELERLGIIRPFDAALAPWRYPPLQETERAAAEILRRMTARQSVAASS